jgi:hypothetical protein
MTYRYHTLQTLQPLQPLRLRNGVHHLGFAYSFFVLSQLEASRLVRFVLVGSSWSLAVRKCLQVHVSEIIDSRSIWLRIPTHILLFRFIFVCHLWPWLSFTMLYNIIKIVALDYREEWGAHDGKEERGKACETRVAFGVIVSRVLIPGTPANH